MMGPDGKLHSKEELAAMKVKVGVGLSNEEEETIARFRSTPLVSDVRKSGAFLNEHKAKTSEFFLKMREHPEELKAMFEFIARKSSHGFTPTQAKKISERLLQDLLTKGTSSYIYINLAHVDTAERLLKVIGPLKPGSVTRNSNEGILRNIRDFEDLIFSGYKPLIREVKNQE